jgi:hypothetical protein
MAWRAFILIERAGTAVPADALTAQLGTPAAKAVKKLLTLRLVVKGAGGYRRGPGTLVEAARTLRTLGTRTWRRALHQDERCRYRLKLTRIGANQAAVRKDGSGWVIA